MCQSAVVAVHGAETCDYIASNLNSDSLNEQEHGVTKESNVGHEAAVVVIVRAACDRVRRHLAVHVEISKPGPAVTET